MSAFSAFILGLLLSATFAAVAGYVGYARLNRAQQQAKEARRLAELGTLAGGLAHEIKNPLSTVQLNLQILSEDIDPAAPNHERIVNRLTTINRETTRLREILDDFLRYAGRMELSLQPTDLARTLEDLADFFAPQAALAKVKLRLNPLATAQPIMLEADPRLLKQTLLNLMLNAVQAMPDGGELILSARADGRYAMIEVTDTGTGMTPEITANIFDAYFTTKRGGTGLGLAMAKRVVQAHQGTMGVDSEPGKGSRFWLKLPLRPIRTAAK
jgi:signal transduction histidine kinase